MKTRIRALRTALNLTQEEFGRSIGVVRSSIAKLESGENNPSRQTIELICTKYNVNPEWLKDGADVPMFLEADDDDDLLIARMLSCADDFRKSIFRTMARMGDDGWAALETIIAEIKKNFPA